MSKTDSAGTATYRRDGVDVTSPVLSDGSATYTSGISERRSGTTTYDLNDRLGTSSRQTNTSAITTATHTYDAFGMLVSSTGTFKGPFGFAGAHGYQEDADSGLQLLGHRYYDGSTGRFLTRDPVKDGRNWYSYCENKPTKAVDEGGEKIKWGVHTTEKQRQDITNALIILILIGGKAGDLANEVLNGEKEYEILPNEIGFYFTTQDKDQSMISITPPPVGYNGQDGKSHPFSMLQAVAHEISHLAGGYKGGGSEPDIIRDVENPLLKKIGQEPRGKYGGEKPWKGPNPRWGPPRIIPPVFIR